MGFILNVFKGVAVSIGLFLHIITPKPVVVFTLIATSTISRTTSSVVIPIISNKSTKAVLPAHKLVQAIIPQSDQAIVAEPTTTIIINNSTTTTSSFQIYYPKPKATSTNPCDTYGAVIPSGYYCNSFNQLTPSPKPSAIIPSELPKIDSITIYDGKNTAYYTLKDFGTNSPIYTSNGALITLFGENYYYHDGLIQITDNGNPSRVLKQTTIGLTTNNISFVVPINYAGIVYIKNGYGLSNGIPIYVPPQSQ